MDYIGAPHPDRDIQQSFPVRGRIRGWFFRVEELPTGYWQVRGRDRYGNTVSSVDVEPEEALLRAEADAQALCNRGAAPIG